MKIFDLMPSVKNLIPHDYDHIRCAEYEKMIIEFLRNCSKGNSFEQVSGAPGAGKTTFCQKSIGGNFISFDKIMESLPSYKNDLQKYGNKQAFANNEITARIIGYEILRRAVEQGYSIVLEHSGVNAAHLELVNNLKKLNYKTKVDFLLCDLKMLKDRASNREKITHRHTPQTMIEQRYALIKEYIEKYKKITDEFNVYNSSDKQYKKIS